jgi:hypothetical protein
MVSSTAGPWPEGYEPKHSLEDQLARNDVSRHGKRLSQITMPQQDAVAAATTAAASWGDTFIGRLLVHLPGDIGQVINEGARAIYAARAYNKARQNWGYPGKHRR